MINSNDKENENNSSNIQATILEPTEENIQICAESIKVGGIVGFPTETVYGLGANALDTEAVKKIFEYKGRPLSDPLIVHVTSKEMAETLINIDDNQSKLFNLLVDKFWPGPLTLVLKANFNVISPILTARTEYIGIRSPKNEIARRLIELSQVPIAAPSANKFCHVSPVNPQHVYGDFKEFPVKIIDGGVCKFRMESTVVKILGDDKKIQILRMGAISPDEIKEFLKENNIDYEVEIFQKINNNINIENNDNKVDFENNLENLSKEAPGQFIKHYSPKLDTYILDTYSDIIINSDSSSSDNIVFLDYNKILHTKFSHLIPNNKNFLDLSPTGNPDEVMLNLYDFLHSAEKIENAEMIILCDLLNLMPDNPHKHTLVDRIVKAAANKRIKFNLN